MVAADWGINLNRESVRVRPQRGRPAISGECNVCKDTPQKAKRQKVKNGPAARLCSIDDIDGYAKRDQYGRRICCLRHDSAWPFSCQTILRPATFGHRALENPDARLAPTDLPFKLIFGP